MKLPNLYYEKKLWKRRVKYVAGADEVGRGCFAGPVLAAAITFNRNIKLKDIPVKINDSKKMTERQREVAYDWIKENATTWGVGEASVSEINRIGMGKAANIAFRRAVGNANIRLHNRIDYLLIDAFYIPYLRGYPKGRNNSIKGHRNPENVILKAKQMAIVNGDEKSISIAAASIIAKVERDRIMTKLSKRKIYKKYGWERNKGYGTKQHQAAIKKHGITRQHRKKFVETFLSKL